MDIGELATQAVVFIGPYLVVAGESVAKKGGEAVAGAAKKVWDTIKSTLTSPAGKEAVQDMEAAPESEDARTALCLQLKKALRDDPALAQELQKLLGSPQVRQYIQQQATASGGGTVIQVGGSRNVSINK